MKKLVEWCFDFTVKSVKTIDRGTIELLFKLAIDWAESHKYGIGGGFNPIMPNGEAEVCLFKFGLTATKDNQFISEKDAHSLLSRLKQFCDKRGYELEGGYREFTQKELELFPIS